MVAPVRPGSGTPSGQRLDHDRADRVQIRLRGGRPARSALRGQVPRSAEHDARERDVVGPLVRVGSEIECLRDAEIGDLRVPVFLEEDVAGLDVPVHDAESVGCSEGAEDLAHHEHHPLAGQRSSGDLVAQGGSGQALHHQVRSGVVLAVVEDGDDVGMRELCRDPRLALEPRAHARQGERLRSKDLDRHRAFEPLVEGVEHPGHAAFAQQPMEAVAASDHPVGGARLHPGCIPGRGSP